MRKNFKRLAYTFLALFMLLNVMMIFHAYKATHFYTDQNLKRWKPEEMSIGDKINAAFFGVSYPKSIVVDSIHAPHKNIRLLTEDGLSLAAWHIDESIDDTDVSKGTVIMFHGHASCRSTVIPEAEAFYRMGYKILMVDFRAHGESEGNTCTIGYIESKDVKAAYDYITSTGEKNIILWGVSLGASTIIKAIRDYHLQPSKVILEMPFGTLLKAAEGRMRTLNLPKEPFAALLAFWGGTEQGFWAFSHKPEDYAKSITCPVLLQRGVNDVRVTAEETNIIFQNIASQKKKLVKYEYCAHESLYRKEPGKWLETVHEFLQPS